METRRGHACADGMLFTDCHMFVSQNCEYLSQGLPNLHVLQYTVYSIVQYTAGHFSILLGTSVYYYRHLISILLDTSVYYMVLQYTTIVTQVYY